MTLTAEPPILSDEEFWRLQQTDGSVRGYELEEGRLVPMAPIHDPQSSSWGKLFLRLGLYLEQHPVGRVWLDFATYLDRCHRYFPDIVYLANEDMYRYDGEKIVGVPTMVCEVASKESRERDRQEKMRAYYGAGVAWYWLLDLVDGRMEEYRWEESGYQLVSRVVASRTLSG
ncbi:MAG: Uma2 family endonuclease [Armatimonadetes bacterium]|nr:Uma2 family endonuclease [Armatimonadota bacterium]